MEATKLPKPTGDIWKPNAKNPATVPISTRLIKTQIKSPFRERERKLWTFLVQAVWDDLDKEIHQLPLKPIGKVFRELSGQHDISWLKEYIRSICKVTVEFEAEDETAEVWKISHLISEANIIQGKGENKGQEFIEFSIPLTIRKILLERKQFARLRPHLILTLSGKYTVTLYELLESVANQKIAIFKASIDDLRSYLAVPKNKLVTWYDFQKRALKPAVNELNNKSEDTGFTVRYDLVRGARRKVIAVHFHVHKVSSRIEFEEKIKTPKVLREPSTLGKFTPREYEVLKKKTIRNSGLNIYELEADWKSQFEDKADSIQNPIAHFTDYCKRRVQAVHGKPNGLFNWFRVKD